MPNKKKSKGSIPATSSAMYDVVPGTFPVYAIGASQIASVDERRQRHTYTTAGLRMTVGRVGLSAFLSPDEKTICVIGGDVVECDEEDIVRWNAASPPTPVSSSAGTSWDTDSDEDDEEEEEGWAVAGEGDGCHYPHAHFSIPPSSLGYGKALGAAPAGGVVGEERMSSSTTPATIGVDWGAVYQQGWGHQGRSGGGRLPEGLPGTAAHPTSSALPVVSYPIPPGLPPPSSTTTRRPGGTSTARPSASLSGSWLPSPPPLPAITSSPGAASPLSPMGGDPTPPSSQAGERGRPSSGGGPQGGGSDGGRSQRVGGGGSGSGSPIQKRSGEDGPRLPSRIAAPPPPARRRTKNPSTFPVSSNSGGGVGSTAPLHGGNNYNNGGGMCGGDLLTGRTAVTPSSLSVVSAPTTTMTGSTFYTPTTTTTTTGTSHTAAPHTSSFPSPPIPPIVIPEAYRSAVPLVECFTVPTNTWYVPVGERRRAMACHGLIRWPTLAGVAVVWGTPQRRFRGGMGRGGGGGGVTPAPPLLPHPPTATSILRSISARGGGGAGGGGTPGSMAGAEGRNRTNGGRLLGGSAAAYGTRWKEGTAIIMDPNEAYDATGGGGRGGGENAAGGLRLEEGSGKGKKGPATGGQAAAVMTADRRTKHGSSGGNHQAAATAVVAAEKAGGLGKVGLPRVLGAGGEATAMSKRNSTAPPPPLRGTSPPPGLPGRAVGETPVSPTTATLPYPGSAKKPGTAFVSDGTTSPTPPFSTHKGTPSTPATMTTTTATTPLGGYGKPVRSSRPSTSPHSNRRSPMASPPRRPPRLHTAWEDGPAAVFMLGGWDGFHRLCTVMEFNLTRPPSFTKRRRRGRTGGGYGASPGTILTGGNGNQGYGSPPPSMGFQNAGGSPYLMTSATVGHDGGVSAFPSSLPRTPTMAGGGDGGDGHNGAVVPVSSPMVSAAAAAAAAAASTMGMRAKSPAEYYAEVLHEILTTSIPIITELPMFPPLTSTAAMVVKGRWFFFGGNTSMQGSLEDLYVLENTNIREAAQLPTGPGPSFFLSGLLASPTAPLQLGSGLDKGLGGIRGPSVNTTSFSPGTGNTSRASSPVIPTSTRANPRGRSPGTEGRATPLPSPTRGGAGVGGAGVEVVGGKKRSSQAGKPANTTMVGGGGTTVVVASSPNASGGTTAPSTPPRHPSRNASLLLPMTPRDVSGAGCPSENAVTPLRLNPAAGAGGHALPSSCSAVGGGGGGPAGWNGKRWECRLLSGIHSGWAGGGANITISTATGGSSGGHGAGNASTAMTSMTAGNAVGAGGGGAAKESSVAHPVGGGSEKELSMTPSAAGRGYSWSTSGSVSVAGHGGGGIENSALFPGGGGGGSRVDMRSGLLGPSVGGSGAPPSGMGSNPLLMMMMSSMSTVTPAAPPPVPVYTSLPGPSPRSSHAVSVLQNRYLVYFGGRQCVLPASIEQAQGKNKGKNGNVGGGGGGNNAGGGGARGGKGRAGGKGDGKDKDGKGGRHAGGGGNKGTALLDEDEEELPTLQLYGDVAVYDTELSCWVQVRVMAGESPCPRYGAAMCAIPPPPTSTSTSMSPNSLATTSLPPGALSVTASAANVSGTVNQLFPSTFSHELVMHGGFGEKDVILKDMWVLQVVALPVPEEMGSGHSGGTKGGGGNEKKVKAAKESPPAPAATTARGGGGGRSSSSASHSSGSHSQTSLATPLFTVPSQQLVHMDAETGVPTMYFRWIQVLGEVPNARSSQRSSRIGTPKPEMPSVRLGAGRGGGGNEGGVGSGGGSNTAPLVNSHGSPKMGGCTGGAGLPIFDSAGNSGTLNPSGSPPPPPLVTELPARAEHSIVANSHREVFIIGGVQPFLPMGRGSGGAGDGNGDGSRRGSAEGATKPGTPPLSGTSGANGDDKTRAITPDITAGRARSLSTTGKEGALHPCVVVDRTCMVKVSLPTLTDVLELPPPRRLGVPHKKK